MTGSQMPESGSPRRSPRAEKWKRPRPARLRTRASRWHAIWPCLIFRADRAEERKPSFRLLDGRSISTWKDLIAYRARQLRTTERSLYRWLAAFDRGGYAALADAPRRDRGFSKAFKNRGLAAALVYVGVVEGRSAAEIHAVLRREWPRLYRGSRCPSSQTTRAFIESTIPVAVRKKLEKVRP